MKYTNNLIKPTWSRSALIVIAIAYVFAGALGHMMGNTPGPVIWCSIIVGAIYAYKRRQQQRSDEGESAISDQRNPPISSRRMRRKGIVAVVLFTAVFGLVWFRLMEQERHPFENPGSGRTAFIEAGVEACVTNYRASETLPSNSELVRFCTCRAEHLADVTTQKQVDYVWKYKAFPPEFEKKSDLIDAQCFIEISNQRPKPEGLIHDREIRSEEK